MAEVADGSGTEPGAGTSLAVAEDGSVAVAWFDAEAGVGFATGPAETPEPVDTAGAPSDGAYPSVTFNGDGSVAYVAWYATEEEDLLVGGYGDFGEIPFAAPSPTPTGAAPAGTASGAECTPVDGGSRDGGRRGDRLHRGPCIEAAPGEPFTIAFDNRDAGAEHNVQVFAGPEPSGDLSPRDRDDRRTRRRSSTRSRRSTQGEYAYNCVIHPNDDRRDPGRGGRRGCHRGDRRDGRHRGRPAATGGGARRRP